MRETYKMKRWMSICLIVVLFLSGMCFEKVKTDPEFGVSGLWDCMPCSLGGGFLFGDADL